MAVYIYNPSYREVWVGGYPSRLAPGKKNLRPYLKNNHSKKGWGHGSSCKVPARPRIQTLEPSLK
jgi:hypothetical protein